MGNNIITEALEAVKEWAKTNQKRNQMTDIWTQNAQTLGSLGQGAVVGPTTGGHYIGSGGYVGLSSNNSGWDTDPFTGRPTLKTQLMMRLDPTGKQEGLQLFEFIDVHKCRDDLFAVFVVKNGKPLIIEDGDLFPSDTLITQLRLLIG